jgi:UDP-N-acetylmuramate dehydrogenase
MAVLLEASQKNGLSGLEMTAGLPGTVGGAAMGNAGSGQLGLAELVEELELAGPNFGRAVLGRRELSPAYRSLGLPKEFRGSAITRVTLKLAPSDSDRVREEATKALASRKQSQPAGPSLGCVFKNPPGFSAGQLIDQCGLKGQACGGSVVSEKHANFFIKRGQSVSEDFTSLAAMARDKVLSDKGILLEPEIKIWSSEGQDIGLPGPAAGR